MSYGKVKDTFWEDEKIEALSDRAAMLALFLMSGDHRNAIGCFKLGLGAITDNARFGKWGTEGVSKALQELSDMGFIVRDERTGWTFIRNTLKHDPIISPKGAIHALSLGEKVPKNTNVYQALAEKLQPALDRYSEHVKSKPGYPMASPFEAPSKPIATPSPLPEPLPEPEPSRGAEVAPLNFPVVVAEQFDWSATYAGFKRHMGTKAGGLVSKLRQCSGEQEMSVWLRMLDRGEIAEPREYFGAIIADRYRGRDKPTMPGNSKTLQVFEELGRKFANE